MNYFEEFTCQQSMAIEEQQSFFRKGSCPPPPPPLSQMTVLGWTHLSWVLSVSTTRYFRSRRSTCARVSAPFDYWAELGHTMGSAEREAPGAKWTNEICLVTTIFT